MDISSYEDKGALVVRPKVSRLDVSLASSFQQEMKRIIGDECQRLVLDLNDVIFIDSSGLTTIVALFKSMTAKNGSMAICGLNGSVAIVFKLTRLDKVMKLCSSMGEALACATE